MTYLIGLDVGTTGCKAVVFTETGKQVGYAYREYGIDTDSRGKAEQDVELVWSLCREVIAGAVASVANEPAGTLPVVALGISVQGDAIIPLDASGAPLYPAILGMDYRSAVQAEECAVRFGGRNLFLRTGMRPHPMNSLCKVLWFRAEHPELWAKTEHIVTYEDFIASRLLGSTARTFNIDYTMASRTMAWNRAGGCWDDVLLHDLGLPVRLFSTAVPSGTPLGHLDKELARFCGLPDSVVVVAGGHDQPCAAVGAGVCAEGNAVVSSGTAEVLSLVFTSDRNADSLYDGYYPRYRSALPGLDFTFALNHVGGLLLRWYRDTWAIAEVLRAEREGTDAYALIAASMPEGISPVLFLPHLNGSGTPTCDPLSMGAILGLTLNTTRGDVAKAIFEALTFELALNVEALSSCGIVIKNLTAVGGGARSPIWLQIKADILGVPIRTLECKEAGCLGAAIIAGYGAGLYNSIIDGIGQCVRFDKTYELNASRSKLYAERFALYKELHRTLRPLHEKLR
ncbi:MAG: FGGY-family carbohydrate kinase [Spirochaetales bacterium]